METSQSFYLLSNRDLRSTSILQKRDRSQQAKYYNFLYLKPGQRDAPHYLASCYWHNRIDSCGFCLFPAELSTAPIRNISKREFYAQAQRWPRPPRHHHSWQKDGRRDKRGMTRRWEKVKQERRVRKIEIMEDKVKGWWSSDLEMGVWDAEDERTSMLIEEIDDTESPIPEDDAVDEDPIAFTRVSIEVESEDWDIVSCVSELSWMDLGAKND